MSLNLSQNKLEFRAVKYREKYHKLIVHTVGKRKMSIMRQMCARPYAELRTDELHLLRRELLRYLPRSLDEETACVIIGFILGVRNEVIQTHQHTKLVRSYFAARETLDTGASLPMEVLEGIRSQYHPDTPSSTIFELTQRQLTQKEKMRLQATAKRREVNLDFDPRHQSVVSLYIYAFERGLNDEIREILQEKARAACNPHFAHQRVGILLDASASMGGSQTQHLKPMSIALAIKDLLVSNSQEAKVYVAGGRGGETSPGTTDLTIPTLIQPVGSTGLAERFLDLLEEDELDAIYIISDGYENTPAGRLNEVLISARSLGVSLPVIHISPVSAAESATGGVRQLIDAPSLAVTRPDALWDTLYALSLKTNLPHGLAITLTRMLQEFKPAFLATLTPRISTDAERSDQESGVQG